MSDPTVIVFSMVFLHLFHFRAIHTQVSLLESAPIEILLSLLLTSISFFHLKYHIFYGFPLEIAKFEGLSSCLPAKSHCINSKPSFIEMWRNFDVGLHLYLVKYIYKPVIKRTNSRIFSSVLVFTFVAFWHGNRSKMWWWAMLNRVSNQNIRKK